MAIFGLLTRKEADAAIMAAVKEAITGTLPQWLLETADANQFNTNYLTAYEAQADMYRKLSWVLQACQLTGESASVVDFSVARLVAGKEPKDIPLHDFEMLLMNPNPLDSRFEFLNASVISYKLTGNTYWFVNAENENAAPDELWFIPSHMIYPVPDGQSYIKGYYYYPGNGKEMLLDPWQIVQFKRFNPFNRFVGMSAIESLALTARGDLAMQEWNSRFFGQNNARLPGVMTFEQMVADPTWAKIKEDTREASKNRELLMLRGVGQGGVNWIQNAVSQKDMEFLEGRKSNAKEIMDTLAPGSYTMLYESATEANSRSGRATFNDLTLYPMLKMMGEKITNTILKLYPGRPLVGKFEDVRVTDRQLELDEQKQYAVTHTIAEIREEHYGDDPLGDDRDKLLPSQINAQSGDIQKPPPPPPAPNGPANVPANNPKQEQTAAQNQPPQDTPQTQAQQPSTAQKAAVVALFAWQRKAVKHVGKPCDFDPADIPAGIVQHVNTYLPTCKSVSAVKSVFDNARDMVRGSEKPKAEQPTDAAMVLEGLRLTLEGLKAAK